MILTRSSLMSQMKQFFESDKDLQKMDPKISCDFDPKSMTAKVKGSQFKADVSVIAEGATSQIQIVIDLPLLLTPFKAKVEETVKRKLSLLLA